MAEHPDKHKWLDLTTPEDIEIVEKEMQKK